MTDLPFGDPLTPANPAAPAPRKCSHPKSRREVEYVITAAGERVKVGERCDCGHLVTLEQIRRGRSARRTGNDAERHIAKGYAGGVRRGQYQGMDDVTIGEVYAVQSKEWASLPSLKKVQQILGDMRHLNRTPMVVVGQPGDRRHALAIVWLEDHKARYGTDGLEP